tara:strand:+ start:166 stop:1275 length:1110 start_codon:yes stop_codon:yes gene_type:complete
MEDKKIRYVFSSGREEKLNNPSYAKEFFYGYDFFKDRVKDVNFIEYKTNKNILLNITDKILRKISNLPFYFEISHTRSNKSELKDSDLIVFTNERLALGSLFMLKKIKKKYETKSVMICMGLFGKKTKNIISLNIQKLVINKLIREIDIIVFLSKTEKEIALKKFPTFHKKYFYIPFCVDSEFWVNEISTTKKNNILFIGNDGKRDYKKVIQLAKELEDYNFTFITSKISENEILSPNVELIKGHWNLSELTDLEMKKYYSSAQLSLIPLIDNLQPSGQSVALQSMSMKVPILISKTKGFWDFENFQNNKHLIFIENNSVEDWVKEIKSILRDDEKREKIKSNSRALIEEKFNLSVFNNELNRLISLLN